MAAGLLVVPGAQPSRDRNGAAVAATLRFYEDLTTTPKLVYQDSDLLVPHAFPVESNDSGAFPLMWADDAELYTVNWGTAAPDLQSETFTGLTASLAASTVALEGAQQAAEDAQQIADDLGDLDAALTTAGTAATTATTQAGIATAAAEDADEARQAAEAARDDAQAIAGGDFQPLDPTLTAVAGLATAADKVGYWTGSDTAALATFTSVARTLVAQTTQALMRTTGLGLTANGSALVAADYAAMKALLDLEIGTDVQAYDADLSAFAALGLTADRVLYVNGAGALAQSTYAAMVALLGLGELTNSELWTGSDTAKVLTARRLFAAAASVSVSDGATITLDGNAGINFHVTLGGNRTFANPSNFKAGQSGRIRITQDATGSRTGSWGSRWDFPSGSITLSTAANSVDILAYYVHDASGSIEATLIKAMS